MPEQQWEIELAQLHRLMRNEATNHERIRDRIMRLQELYYEGAMGDGATSWERWAIDSFAYSSAVLRFYSQPHPLQQDAAARKEQRSRDKQIKGQQALDSQLASAGWNDYLLSLKAAHKAGINAQLGDDIQTIKAPSPKPKQKKRPPSKTIPKPLPPDPEIVEVIRDTDRIERVSRIELGRRYAFAKEKVDTKQVEKNPKTGQHWTWMKYAAEYFPRSIQDIRRCIALYEESLENGTSCSISQDGDVQNNNVVNIVRKP